jgi:hypothetical protein
MAAVSAPVGRRDHGRRCPDSSDKEWANAASLQFDAQKI